MKRKAELVNSIENEIDSCNNILAKLNVLTDYAPKILRKKEDAQIALDIVNALPDSAIQDFDSNIFVTQKNREESIAQINNNLLNFDEIPLSYFDSSGTASPIIYSLYNNEEIVIPFSSNIENYEPIKHKVELYIDDITKQEYIREHLQLLDSSLVRKFDHSITSFEKCKAKILFVSQCAMDLRNFLNDLWSELGKKAKHLNNDPTKDTRNLERKREKDRVTVAEILSINDFQRDDLLENLNKLNQLFIRLSDSGFGKNSLSDDMKLLTNYFNQWVIVTYDITNIIN